LLPGNLIRKEKMKCSLCEEKELQQTRGMVTRRNYVKSRRCVEEPNFNPPVVL